MSEGKDIPSWAKGDTHSPIDDPDDPQSFELSDWGRLAVRLDLPVGAFGDFMETEWTLEVARATKTAKDDLACFERAIRALKKVRGNAISLEDVIESLELGRDRCLQSLKDFPANGPQRRDAYFVADKVAQAFVNAGRPVRFGMKDDGVSPSSRFGKAVEIALKELGVAAGWRGPVEAAVKKYRFERKDSAGRDHPPVATE